MPQTDAMQERREPGGEGVLNLFVKGATAFAKKNKTISTGYLVGILLLLFGTGFKVSEQAALEYDQAVGNINYDSLRKAHASLYQAKDSYDRTRGWFGSCDNTCARFKTQYEAAQRKYDAAKAQETEAIKSAKSKVGIMSEYGVQETRDMFWGVFSGGKDFAKRQSMWDLLFTGLRWGKDEELFSVVIRWLVQLLINFTIGMVGALVVFIAKLWGLIQAYSPDPATAVLYFVLGSVTATACVGTYLLLLYSAAAGSVAVAAKAIVDHNHRIRNDPNYAARQRAHLQGGGAAPRANMGGGGGNFGSGYAGGDRRRTYNDHID